MPRHIRNIIIATLLAVLALAAGINGYIHHQFKTNIDQTLSSIQPFAQIKYSDLSTSIISGEVKLKMYASLAHFYLKHLPWEILPWKHRVFFTC